MNDESEVERKKKLLEHLETNFYSRYQKYLKYAMPQGLYLPKSNPGLCREISLHWIKRGLNKKRSFAESSKSTTPEGVTGGLDSDRMRKKFIKYEAASSQYQDDLGAISRYKIQAKGMISINLVASTMVGSLGSLKFKVTGDEFFAKLNSHLGGGGFFLIALEASEGGHGVAIESGDTAVKIMDPNIGEFEFPEAAEDDFGNFISDWWNNGICRAIGLGNVKMSIMPITL